MTAAQLINLLAVSFWETLYMSFLATFFAYILGLPLGIILTLTDRQGLLPKLWLNRLLGFLVNILRSVPFLILLVLMIPFTRVIVGTAIGTTATIVPLVVAAFPFVARLVESSLKEVNPGVVEAAQAMGASPLQIVGKVWLPEARASLLIGLAIATTTIIGYSALAGFVGGGGLGTVAINYGLNRYNVQVMLWTVACLILIVQITQAAGNKIARHADKRIQN